MMTETGTFVRPSVAKLESVGLAISAPSGNPPKELMHTVRLSEDGC